MHITPLPPHENRLYFLYARHHSRTVEEQKLADTEEGVVRYIRFINWLLEKRKRFAQVLGSRAFNDSMMFDEETFRIYMER